MSVLRSPQGSAPLSASNQCMSSSEKSRVHPWSPWMASILLVVLSMGLGCSDEETALLLEVRTRTQLTKLFVYVKQYHENGRVTLYQEFDQDIDPLLDSYVVTVNGDPLFLNIDLPTAGRYAVHLVGVPVGAIEADPTSDRHIATVCHDLTTEGNVVLDDDVYLGRLTRGSDGLDVDSDTFPESLQAFCNAQANSGFPCDTGCNDPDYLAMIDCNPAEDYEYDELACENIGEPTEWNPFARDTCGDCHDQDCWGGDATCYDDDEDGYPANLDCDDHDALRNPGVDEICGNAIDENCTIDIEPCIDGDIPCDDDGDGFLAIVEGMDGCGSDCDDTNAQIHPDVPEGLGSDPTDPLALVNCDDGIDNNCNGRIDERCENDLDADGIELEFDCNDCNAAIGPGFAEVCGNEGTDEDCDGVDLLCSPNDQDGDGYDAEPIGTDCNDNEYRTHPGAADYCGDGVAQNCALDQACRSDDDGDFFDVDDCNDEIAGTNPWAVERCDTDGIDAEGLDDDCDGQLNEVPWELNLREGCGFYTGSAPGEPTGWVTIEYDTNVDNCGVCHHACDLGANYREGDHCQDGNCMCFLNGYGCDGDVTNYCCPDGCQDISFDEEHCGGCTEEHQCVEFGDEECTPTGPGGRGECHCPHEADSRRCELIDLDENACCPGIGCTNVHDDVENCGRCGTSCTADDNSGPRGDLCAQNASGDGTCYCGAFGVICTGNTWCTGVGPNHAGEGSCGCHDLTSEFSYCGRCGLECDENEECVNSNCWCEYAGADCDGTDTDFCCPNDSECVNLMTDVAHCGDCFAPDCRPGETCEGGSCRCAGGGGCGANQVCCPGIGCTNVLTDESNCGPATDLTGCGHECQAGVECDNGFCSCGAGGDCGGGETCCFDTYCVDLETDPDNCGVCATECRVGEECYSGDCECGSDCNDGNSCTEDPCVGVRCEHHTLDNDNDGYCGDGCRDQDSGETGDCINGDCDDDNAEASPGDLEDCDTSFDDDCDGGTNDLDAEHCDDFYFDGDDDTYGLDGNTQCRCRASGEYTATQGEDCNDSNNAVNPSRTDICNGVDDDCSGATADGSADCSGGAAYCCGPPEACRSCCLDSQCSGTNNLCTSYNCACRSDWTDCGGTCNCETGGGQVCCSNNCYNGTCCGDGDCSSAAAPDCNTTSHTCACIGGMVCGSTCVHGAGCCGDGDCGGADPNCCSNQCEECCNAADCGTGDWTCGSNNCNCAGINCSGNCYGSGNCCGDGDCGGANPNCCSNVCEECCNAADCGTGDWTCTGNNCGCAGEVCGGECFSGGECCDDSDCTDSDAPDCNTSNHTCQCIGGRVCGGTCYHGAECCTNTDCTDSDAPDCRTSDHTCQCTGGRVCGGTCYHGAECCTDTDCTDSDAPDCRTSDHTCQCLGGIVCGGTCRHGGNCCDDGDCSGTDTCVGYVCGCTPFADCGEAGYQCGTGTDGCSGTLSCGACSGDQNPDCQSNDCTCSAEGSDCSSGDHCCSSGCQECCDGGDCGGGEVCCGWSCFTGTCCDDGDCSSSENPDCNASGHTCYCADEGGTCSGGQLCCSSTGCADECCGNGDCTAIEVDSCSGGDCVCSTEGGGGSPCTGGEYCCSGGCQSGSC